MKGSAAFRTWAPVCLMLAVFLPCMVCLVAGSEITRYDNILDLESINLWALGISGVASTAVSVLLRSRSPSVTRGEKAKSAWSAVFLWLFCLMLFGRTAYVVLSLANSGLDHSKPEGQAVTIIDKKHYAGGKGPELNQLLVSLTQGGTQTELDVPSALYQSFNAGDLVSVKLHPGALGFAWAEILGRNG